jgi:hypothetical protein
LASRAGARGISVGLSRHRLDRLVDAGQVVEASEADHGCRRSARQRLVEHFGAPDLASARPAAEEEIAFASALTDHPKGMLVAVARKFEDGGIREVFRTLAPSIGPKPIRAYAFLEVVGEEDTVTEQVDLLTLGKESSRE